MISSLYRREHKPVSQPSAGRAIADDLQHVGRYSLNSQPSIAVQPWNPNIIAKAGGMLKPRLCRSWQHARMYGGEGVRHTLAHPRPQQSMSAAD